MLQFHLEMASMAMNCEETIMGVSNTWSIRPAVVDGLDILGTGMPGFGTVCTLTGSKQDVTERQERLAAPSRPQASA